MICPLCHQTNDDAAERCACGFRFVVATNELPDWFNAIRSLLENSYLAAETPWQQSGKSGPFEEWVRLRIPISECVETSGTFLDIGCANGFLLECLLDWAMRKGVRIEPYGVDYSPKLAALARQRLQGFAENIFVGNAWDWQPPLRFDYVRTEVCYVPMNLAAAYISRLLADFLVPGGKLLVAQYRSRREDLSGDWIDDYLSRLGFSVRGSKSGFSGDGLELTRVAVLQRWRARATCDSRRGGWAHGEANLCQQSRKPVAWITSGGFVPLARGHSAQRRTSKPLLTCRVCWQPAVWK